MQVLDGSEDKVKKICETLKNRTLDPAKKEAKDILEKALKEAEKIVIRARDDAKKLLEEQRKRLEQEKNVLQASLNLACKQAIQVLKLEIEDKIFNSDIGKLITKAAEQETIIAEFITAMVKATEKAGLDGHLELILPSLISPKKVSEKLASEILSRIDDRIITSTEFQGGARLKLNKHKMTIEMTDETVKSLLMKFIREDFRERVFNANN